MPAPRLPLTRLRDLGDGVRRRVLQHRRPLAVLLTVAAVAAGVRTVAPPDPPTVDVVVAARALPAGSVLGEDDVATVALPPGAAPDGTVDDPVGASLAGAVGRGEPLTTTRLLDGDGASAPTGHTAVPVRLSDPAQADLLRVGMRIDVLATDPRAGATETVAPGATVLVVPPRPDGGATGGLTGRVVVLAVPNGRVAAVTAASVARYVTFAWSPV